ncbi:MAG: hypothetical protein KBT03_11065 [Bacteroidales bacterium]|nr:hypothetical protein [Candidatus Scybalousia scybalohippi]
MNEQIRPTESQIAEAKNYIERRLDAQQEVEDELYFEFQEAARKIAAIVIKYKFRNIPLRFSGSSMMAIEIEKVIRWLEIKIDELLSEKYLPDEADDQSEEHDSNILESIRGDFHGATFEDRKELYISKYILALKQMNFDNIEIDEEEIYEAIMESSGYPVRRMQLLLSNTVALGWMTWSMKNAIENGAIGFYVVNGSNPCSFCVDKSKHLHRIGEETPPFHPSCMCMVVYV